jgi:RNA polymerase sigma-70 factor, ECF subfamily
VPRSSEGIGSIEELYDAFAGPLYLYAWRRLGDRGAAEEAVQDTLVRAWRHAHRFNPERGSLPAWLFAIARNVATDRLRRRAARPGEDAPLTEMDVPLSDGDVDRALEAWQLAEALAGLSREHREAIVQVHYLGFTVREAATRTGVPEGTVKSRLYYGLRALRLRLEEMGVVR